jgi:hypothetical protein
MMNDRETATGIDGLTGCSMRGAPGLSTGEINTEILISTHLLTNKESQYKRLYLACSNINSCVFEIL